VGLWDRLTAGLKRTHEAVTGRIAQAFVFAGPRGVGKTTTARILARMLNCEQGPTPDPCGACDPCREIAEGRDMDVLELDAATHTGIDNIRDVIISGLAILPARDRYKVFVIDEVHQLSSSSFNALLKSIEEPPPHVAFIMATTAPDKIPDTIVSRSQVFEFKTIASRGIAEQLQKIAEADGITVSHEAIALVARAAEGSMRDAETAFDQVLAFAGNTVNVDDVARMLGDVSAVELDRHDRHPALPQAANHTQSHGVTRHHQRRLHPHSALRSIRPHDLLAPSWSSGPW